MRDGEHRVSREIYLELRVKTRRERGDGGVLRKIIQAEPGELQFK
jgi:hypothetical protein